MATTVEPTRRTRRGRPSATRVRQLSFLDHQHEVYKARWQEWERAEIRYEGGPDVLDELWRWPSEASEQTVAEVLQRRDVRTKDVLLSGGAIEAGRTYEQRQLSATYLKFPEMYATAMIGHIIRLAPVINWDTLGTVERREGAVVPDPAELFYYNVDGVGGDGSMFWNFFADVAKRAAGATGFRWVFVENASVAAQNRADELAGVRPYLIHWSPLDVTDWHFERGELAYAVVRIPIRNPKVNEKTGALEGADSALGYYLFTRAGWDGFGSEFAAGGWWMFDGEKNDIDAGDWSATGGRIPMTALYYERSSGTRKNGTLRPNMARSGAAELGNAAIAYMNLSSAADFDAIDAAESIVTVVGADEQNFNTWLAKRKAGSKYLPMPLAATGERPEIHDSSMGAVAAEVFAGRLENKRSEARDLAALEATSVPDSSGTSKQAGFTETKVPRLTLIASGMEAAINAILPWVQNRWGVAAPGQGRAHVRMPREFELRDVLADLQVYFTIRRDSGISSPTADAKAMTLAALKTNIISEDDQTAVEAEFNQSVKDKAASEAAFNALAAGGGGGADDDDEDDDTPPAE